MKVFTNFIVCLLGIVGFEINSDCCGQIHISKDRIVSLTAPPLVRFSKLASASKMLTPQFEAAFTIVPGIGGIDDSEPNSGSAFFVAVQGTTETGMVEDALMDGVRDVIGTDLENLVDSSAIPSDVTALERLELRGKDATTGRYIVELTVSVQVEGDFPLNPDNLPLEKFDVDSDGTDECIRLSEVALFVGTGAGGTGIMFDPKAGPPVVLAALWELFDFQGNYIFDFNGDGQGDPAIITNFPEFHCPVIGGWNGSLGISFVPDADPKTPETATGTMETSQLRVTYLSNLDTEFGFICGDVDQDGEVTLLDIAPFIELISIGGYQIEADINNDGSVDLLDVEGFVEKLIGI